MKPSKYVNAHESGRWSDVCMISAFAWGDRGDMWHLKGLGWLCWDGYVNFGIPQHI